MNGKYKNKYRIKSARLQGYDYRTAGFYFVTICTENRYNYFGEIINQRMQLSHIGILSNVFWYEIVNHAKNIKLHQFVAMPNHIHGILEIADGDGNDDVETMHASSLHASSLHASSLHDGNSQFSEISPKSGSLARVVGSYKSAVTKHAHRLGYEFGWQSRFHDHIIRNGDEFNRIQQYVKNNPRVWADDRFHTGNGIMEDTVIYGEEPWMI